MPVASAGVAEAHAHVAEVSELTAEELPKAVAGVYDAPEVPGVCAICLECPRTKPSACTSPSAYNHSGPCVREARYVPYRTHCGHVFHRCCLLHMLWIETGCDVAGEEDVIACPLCRSDVRLKVVDGL
jgi:hypothetical protein